MEPTKRSWDGPTKRDLVMNSEHKEEKVNNCHEVVWDNEIGRHAKTARDKVVLEGRDELLQVLIALRKAGNHALAKELWETHTGWKKCPHCRSISKAFVQGYFSFHRGYEASVCKKCYDSFSDEADRRRKHE